LPARRSHPCFSPQLLFLGGGFGDHEATAAPQLHVRAEPFLDLRPVVGRPPLQRQQAGAVDRDLLAWAAV